MIAKNILSLSEAESLIDILPHSSHLKEVKSGKYILSNVKTLSLFGFNLPKDIIGLTLKDVDSFMGRFWGNNAKEVEEYDNTIICSANKVVDTDRAWLTFEQQVFRHKMFKYPVINKNGTIKYILTISEKNDLYLDTFSKYELYKKLLSPHLFVPRFLEDLGIFNCFFVDNLPTETEIINLLFKLNYFTNKEIAFKRAINVKTVEKQLSCLRDRILPGFYFEDLLTLIICKKDNQE